MTATAKKQLLQECLEDWDRHTIIRIEIVYSNGTRAGVGNPQGINAAMSAMRNEIQRQINELK